MATLSSACWRHIAPPSATAAVGCTHHVSPVMIASPRGAVLKWRRRRNLRRGALAAAAAFPPLAAAPALPPFTAVLPPPPPAMGAAVTWLPRPSCTAPPRGGTNRCCGSVPRGGRLPLAAAALALLPLPTDSSSTPIARTAEGGVGRGMLPPLLTLPSLLLKWLPFAATPLLPLNEPPGGVAEPYRFMERELMRRGS